MLMLWELLFFLRKSLQFYQMLYIIHLLFTDGFPSGQRGQTVNLLAPPSKVRILLHPSDFNSYILQKCESYFLLKKENRKGTQSRFPPTHYPSQDRTQAAASEEAATLFTHIIYRKKIYYLLTLLTVLPARNALILSTVISMILCLEA